MFAIELIQLDLDYKISGYIYIFQVLNSTKFIYIINHASSNRLPYLPLNNPKCKKKIKYGKDYKIC